MSISPISGYAGVSPTSYLTQAAATKPSSGATDAAFGSSLGSAVDGLQQMQSTSSDLAIKAVTGDLSDVHDYTIAATQSAVAMELTATIRNKAIDAFSEIMRMQA